ncbi:unnamed protein product [Rotaria magnacalcarata]|uniref:RDD domain-containing protein n=1 Tax=Rotaria magnacalcarata TaxID=392030 RepID=A0A816ZIC3_9BILA|nr:unnamed protein product [Rotaria magnacalcarata]CAF2097971.1 unnamed protein product [Rotaria magnacalcarata]CAF2194913.1 unnamed protein product [Rotaria magnacalcarata]
MSNNSAASVENEPRKMTVEEYSELVAKWQQAYYTWNSSYLSYFNTMVMNTFVQQISMLIGADFLKMTTEPVPVDRLRARIKVASVWRRCLAEIIDFILLHAFKILIVTFLSNYLHLLDPNRLTLNSLISNLIYDEAVVFPTELFCIEIIYLIISVIFESACLTYYGATPGKRLLRLRVLKFDRLQINDDGDITIESGTVLDSVAALTRSSIKILMATFLFPAVLVALLTSQNRQTSYDMAANTLVVELEHRAEIH